jgi:hypothetical protein
MNTKTARIRALNDELRQHLTGGMAVITPGVAALGSEAGSPFSRGLPCFSSSWIVILSCWDMKGILTSQK